MSMAAPLWRLVCQTKSNRIQAVAQELVKISLFYIYMNRYLHIKVFSFVPKVDLTFRIGHMSENISYYGLLQPIRYKPKYNANIRIRIGFWVANIRIQFFVFVSALHLYRRYILLATKSKAKFRQYGYSELSDTSHYIIMRSVKVMCAELLFAEKWRPTKAIGRHFSTISSYAHITFTL